MSGDNPAAATDAPIAATSLRDWFTQRFAKYLPYIRADRLQTTFFSASYGELHEYGADFIRIVQLIDSTTDPKSISREVGRFGWRWYRLATDRDFNIRMGEDGKPIRMRRDEAEAKDVLLPHSSRENVANADWMRVYITTRMGDVELLPADHGLPLPCYLFRAKHRKPAGEDFLTAQDFLGFIEGRPAEAAVCEIVSMLAWMGGRVPAALRTIETALQKPELLHTDVDLRKKLRQLDMHAISRDSPGTSDRITATQDFLEFFSRTSSHV